MGFSIGKNIISSVPSEVPKQDKSAEFSDLMKAIDAFNAWKKTDKIINNAKPPEGKTDSRTSPILVTKETTQPFLPNGTATKQSSETEDDEEPEAPKTAQAEPLFAFKKSSEDPYVSNPVYWADDAIGKLENDFLYKQLDTASASAASNSNAKNTLNIMKVIKSQIDNSLGRLKNYLNNISYGRGDESTLMAAKNTMTDIIGQLYGMNNQLRALKDKSNDSGLIDKLIADNLLTISEIESIRDTDPHTYGDNTVVAPLKGRND